MDSTDLRKSFLLNEMDQQNAIRLQQIEAIKLIQISLDKLTCTNTVQLKSQNTQKSNTVLVYKETNLHKNLLVNKILNKAKYIYYQGVVQAMRLSLMSKLNYYTNLIHQLNNTNSESAEASLVDEMKVLMQQILHETYQFNLTNQPNPLDLAFLFNTTEPDAKSNSQTDEKRVKNLNDFKMSLFNFMYNQTNIDKPKPSAKRTSQEVDDEDENLNVDDDVDDRACKKCKINEENSESTEFSHLDLNNNQILNDETNNKEINKRNLNKKFKLKNKSSTSSKILNIECLV